jgi:hypothetical protein
MDEDSNELSRVSRNLQTELSAFSPASFRIVREAASYRLHSRNDNVLPRVEIVKRPVALGRQEDALRDVLPPVGEDRRAPSLPRSQQTSLFEIPQLAFRKVLISVWCLDIKSVWCLDKLSSRRASVDLVGVFARQTQVEHGRRQGLASGS